VSDVFSDMRQRILKMEIGKILIFSLIFIHFSSFGQTEERVLKWTKINLTDNEGKTLQTYTLEYQGLDNGVATYFETIPMKSAGKVPVLVQFTKEVASSTEEKLIRQSGKVVEEDFKPEIKFVKDAGKEHLSISFLPYVQENGKFFRILSLSWKYEVGPIQSVNKDFATESVLRQGNGRWYKIAVKNDGVHRIDKAFLESLGISTANLNPAHIHIYGNGEGALPELNSVPRIDDLKKNAILVFGEQDGRFDDGDYILFYAWGPHRWFANGTVEFEQRRNPYTDLSHYFININSSEAPLRISNIPSIDSPSDVVLDNYDFRDIYENDLVSLVKGGQRWYGELFDVELQRTFNFNIPNVEAEAIQFKVAMASNAVSSSGTFQRYLVNGQLLNESPLPASGGVDYSRSVRQFTYPNPVSTIPLTISVTRTSPNTLTYLDRILLNGKRKLVFFGAQMGFRNLKNQNETQIAEYAISSVPSNAVVWDLSDRHEPKIQQGFFSGNNFRFRTQNTYKEYVMFNGSSFFTPEGVGEVASQNLHALPQADYLIVTHIDFLAQANRLAELHRGNGLTVHVVTTEQVFNEFSSGNPDAVGIRMFAKMFYDRAANGLGVNPKYMLLFGDGTYDAKNRVPNNNNFVMTYQVDLSENHISALVTDDFFGMLDNNESITSSDMLDIGIGRILASNVTQAKQQVDKIEHYMKNGSDLFATNASCCLGQDNSSTYGDWRTKFVQIADDEDNGYFINNDTEPQYKWVKNNHRYMNCEKLYMDAFPQQTTAGGHRYPDVFDAITRNVQRGSLIVNYVGHGGEVGLAEERVVTIPQIQSWTNINALNLFVSATCEFTKYDDPTRVSAGEWVSLNPQGGAIALMTTTRPVFFGVNSNTGMAFYRNVFTRDENGQPLAFGEIVRRTKNLAGNSDNKRSFTLIGDPALKIALPDFKVVTDSINGKSVNIQMDTIRALTKVTVKGHLENQNGTVLSGFDGVLTPSIFDKIRRQKTLGQDPSSPIIEYELQRNVVYRGQASVKNGYFQFSFVVPKDIALDFGNGKISYYANNQLDDAIGYDTSFFIGGIDPNGISDEEGPDLEIFMNDEQFVNGSITDASPVLLLKAFDENGINTVGNGIGHDIVAILDGKVSNPIVLNDFYISAMDDYQKGEVRYQFLNLEPGPHSVEVKVWDVNNNSSVAKIDFVVQESKKPVLSNVYNYPNPFTTRTNFLFEHNQSCSSLDVQVQVYTVSGKLVKTIHRNVPTLGFRQPTGIEWDGLDEYGDQLAKGVYVYRLKIRNPDGETTEKTEKLVILK